MFCSGRNSISEEVIQSVYDILLRVHCAGERRSDSVGDATEQSVRIVVLQRNCAVVVIAKVFVLILLHRICLLAHFDFYEAVVE
jgi:hypothetical protein